MFKKINFVFAFLMGLVLFPFIYTVGPLAERHYMPVISHATITKIINHQYDYVSEDALDFWASATKLRQCNYDHLEWFSGDPKGANSRLTMQIQEHGRINPVGSKFEFGPVRVYINEQQLKTNTFAIVYHDCHFGWLSQSLFYP